MQLDQALLGFGKLVIGSTIRKQVVSGVGLDIDTISQPEYDLRYILYVYFRTNRPADDLEPEERMLEVVFSEIPKSGRIVTSDRDKICAILSGTMKCSESDWRLDDEDFSDPRIEL